MLKAKITAAVLQLIRLLGTRFEMLAFVSRGVDCILIALKALF